MKEERLAMSQKERDRLHIIWQLKGKIIKQKGAAMLLGLSVRQTRRILKIYRREGDIALVHKSRGRASNRKTSEEKKQKVIARIKERYLDFGPTLAMEYIEEDGLGSFCKETIRQFMTEAGIWQPRGRKVKHRQWRERKSCWGEMVQWDTSIHDWLEGRGEEIVLIKMIDDATSRIRARFFNTDSMATNMAMLKTYLIELGRPKSVYVDKASHFKTTRQPSIEEDLRVKELMTQIERACAELNIKVIFAHSPQAKGRVERSFKTDQDRLVKMLRLENVCSTEEANRVLQEKFIPLFNTRFAVEPASCINAHGPLEKQHNLDAILSRQENRSVENNYTFSYKTRRFQILKESITAGLRGGRILVEERLNDSIHAQFKNKYLNLKETIHLPKPASENGLFGNAGRALPVNRIKQHNNKITRNKTHKPHTNHPWRLEMYQAKRNKKRTFLNSHKGDISILL